MTFGNMVGVKHPLFKGGEEAVRQPMKARFDLLDPEFIEAMAEVMAYGATKYGEKNWMKPGLDGEKSGLNHAFSHLHAYAADHLSELPHGTARTNLAQAAINCMFEFYHCQRRENE